MTQLWPMEPTVAASDFNPFTREVAMPMTVRDASTRARPAARAGDAIRPARRNLLLMGLASGDAADALEARSAAGEAGTGRADTDKAGTGEAGAGTPGSGPGDAPADGVGDPGAIAALATELRERSRRRERLAHEVATLDGERAALQARLLRLLGRAPQPPEPATLRLPAGTGLPTATWR